MYREGYFRTYAIITTFVFSFPIFTSNVDIHAEEHEEQDGIEFAGIVNFIVDGDTLDLNNIRIRLALVDTPERGQDGFMEAKNFVQGLCLNKKGEVDIDDGQRRGDIYGREIGVVYCDGININRALIEKKLATIYTEYCDISEFAKENWTIHQCLLMR